MKSSSAPRGELAFTAIEPLEARIAPAVLVNPTTLTYVDQDGDNVTVKFSLPLLTNTTAAAAIFTFNTGTVKTGTDSTEQQLELIDLNGLAATGLSITLTAKQAGQGDGFAAVGYIEATSDLGAISIDGDLGGISAGVAPTGAKPPPGVKSLSLLSMGAYGLTTQPASGGAFTPTLASTILGELGSLSVKTDIFDAEITAGSIGTIKIGGSLVGGSAAGSGSILSSGNIGAISIGGDVDGGIGASSGDLTAQGAIASIKIGGSLIGAAEPASAPGTSSSSMSGFISSTGNMGAVSVGHDINAGYFDESGKIQCGGAMKSLTVGGSILGGDGAEDTSSTNTAHGQIAVKTNLALLKVAGDITGAGGEASGAILANGELGNVTVGGGVTGGDGDLSAYLLGSNKMGSVSILGSVLGGGGADSAYIFTHGSMGAVKVGGSVSGGSDYDSGAIRALGAMASVTVGGSVVGGSVLGSGEIASGICGAITIKGSIQGGSALSAGSVFTDGNTAPITIDGSIIGGSVPGSGVVEVVGNLPSLQVDGSIVAGTSSNAGGFSALGTVGSIVVKGSVLGTTAEHAFIYAAGYIPSGGKTPKTDVAIKSVTIGGDLVYGDVFASGPDTVLDAEYANGSAQLGAVKIGGNFIGSDIAAGAGPGTNGYGQGATVLAHATAGIYSAIASITIGGQAIGTFNGDTTGTIYGIVAQEIGSVKIGSATIALKPGAGNDATPIALGITGDLNLYELAI